MSLSRYLLAALLGTTLLALSLCATITTVPASAKLTVIGIADQKPTMFEDLRFGALNIAYVRRAVAWDALTVDWQRAELDDWMAKAQAASVAPLLTMEHSRQPGRTRLQPSAPALLAQFAALRARYPWVTDYSAWNEANCRCQATWDNPELVAAYWKAMQRACAGCRVLGADLLDVGGMQAWITRFLRAAKTQPRFWGLHNYVTANRFQDSAVREVLAATRGELWLTETGGLVARRNKSTIRLPEGIAHAAQVTSFILGRLPAINRRVTRAYFYQWNSASPSDSWDSSFVGADGVARPSLAILQSALSALGGPPPIRPPAPTSKTMAPAESPPAETPPDAPPPA